MRTDFAAELYADAIAIEREAAKRYAELGERMADCGNHAVAALFRMLAWQEGAHLARLLHKTSGMRLPALDADHSWPESEAPETVGRALCLALEAEKSARAFFEQAARVADDPDGRELANEMALEEAHHEALIRRMLERCTLVV
jgi:rubrerythrin